MKKTIICNIPMKDRIDCSVYRSDDNSIPVSTTAVKYPINAFLEETIESGTELKVILIVKDAEYSSSAANTAAFKSELEATVSGKDVQIKYVYVDTDFSQKQSVHEKLMERVVDELDESSHIIVDITYGPKDLPLILFSALSFAEKFLNCEIENLIYGQAEFANGQAVNTKICDMSPLFYLTSAVNSVNASDPDKARKMLKSMLSL